MNLQTPIRGVSKAYTLYARRLEKLGITKIEDFLFHVPFRYEDFSVVSKITNLQVGEIVTVKSKVIEIKNNYLGRFKTIQRGKIEDETGSIDIIWFNQPFIPKSVKIGDFISVCGKVELNKNKLIFRSPDYEIITSPDDVNTIHTGRMVPIYSETRGISSKWIRRQTYNILKTEKNSLLEYFPDEIIKNGNLMGLTEAIEQIHFPEKLENAQRARRRLAFEEMFMLHISSLKKKEEWKRNLRKNKIKVLQFKEKIDKFTNSLPFELTGAQKKAVEDILKDLEKDVTMNRLLQGDVGSGKTIVCTIIMYLCFLNGYKSLIMAPTEILAVQHYKTISDLLSPLGIKVSLVTSGNKHKGLAFDVIIGTHALLHQKIDFEKLQFVVIDEQQRFGVKQRSAIRKMNVNPDFLTMTATPIPRTIALTMYGELDLSYLNEMPKLRKKIKTWLVPDVKKENAYKWIEKQIIENTSQAFIVCPFIEESETMKTVKAATKEFKTLKDTFPKLKLGLLHGKQKSKEKNEILDKFREGKIDILVSTPVVEVGIDIPNATIIVIEGAERFGLSQLHQLRGRVGRGTKESYCLLFSESRGPEAYKRLKALETMHSGAELAELDLSLRGPGQIHGTLQHGLPELKIASFSDFDLIKETRNQAEKILPNLSKYPKLLERIEIINSKEVSPD